MKSTVALALSLGRSSLREPRDRSDQRGRGKSTRSDLYARPDVYDMEYEGVWRLRGEGRFRADKLTEHTPV